MVNSPDADVLSEGEDLKLKSCDMRQTITHGEGGGRTYTLLETLRLFRNATDLTR